MKTENYELTVWQQRGDTPAQQNRNKRSSAADGTELSKRRSRRVSKLWQND